MAQDAIGLMLEDCAELPAPSDPAQLCPGPGILWWLCRLTRWILNAGVITGR